MYIHEAIKARTEKAPFITREKWRKEFASADVRIRPTNSPDCCIIESKVNKSPCRGWQPMTEDLLADDWYAI